MPIPSGWLLLVTENVVPTSQTINANWVFTALDANGKDVGVTCYGG